VITSFTAVGAFKKEAPVGGATKDYAGFSSSPDLIRSVDTEMILLDPPIADEGLLFDESIVYFLDFLLATSMDVWALFNVSGFYVYFLADVLFVGASNLSAFYLSAINLSSLLNQIINFQTINDN